ncbi:MAG: hypothetical protein EZS28_010469, partial [Streblomastix strix]
MLYPGIGGALGAGANLAGAVDRHKRGNSSGGMISNEQYLLFIDNNNALVYSANKQIVDGIASDYALKIERNGLLTIKNQKVINFDFVAQINQLIKQVNLLYQSNGTNEQDITDKKNDIDTFNQELSRQTHFRGNYLLNTDIQNLPSSANGDFAFSAESGAIWMLDQNCYIIGDIVPDQVSPASDAIPQLSIVSGNAGVSTEYARGDHQHPLQVSTVLPAKDTAIFEESVANTYARSDHTHHVNLGNSVPKKDTRTGTAGSANVYTSATHQQPLNIDPTTANVPLVNATAATNGTSDYYCRNDHFHPSQLIYIENVTATKFIKTRGLATEVLCANGETTSIDSIISRTYNGSDGGWIRLCNFHAGASVGNPFIEFEICTSYNSVQLVRLTYGAFHIKPPYPQLQLIGIFEPFATPQTTSYVNISV